MDFGEQMTKWREDSGLTRKEFARKLSVSLTAVKNWETGHLNHLEPDDEVNRIYSSCIGRFIP